MMNRLVRLIRDTRGATAIEYGLICALVVLGMLGALRLFAGSGVGTLNMVNSRVSGVMGPS